MSIYKKKKIIERITLMGPMAEKEKWILRCHKNGYRITRIGPKSIGRTGSINPARFHIIAEREMDMTFFCEPISTEEEF